MRALFDFAYASCRIQLACYSPNRATPGSYIRSAKSHTAFYKITIDRLCRLYSKYRHSKRSCSFWLTVHQKDLMPDLWMPSASALSKETNCTLRLVIPTLDTIFGSFCDTCTVHGCCSLRHSNRTYQSWSGYQNYIKTGDKHNYSGDALSSSCQEKLHHTWGVTGVWQYNARSRLHSGEVYAWAKNENKNGLNCIWKCNITNLLPKLRWKSSLDTQVDVAGSAHAASNRLLPWERCEGRWWWWWRVGYAAARIRTSCPARLRYNG